MKLRAAIAFSLLSVVCAAQGQAQSSQFGPAYVGVIEAVIDGRRTPLERMTGVFAARSRSMFIGGMETGIDFEGGSSPVRIRAGQDFFFVTRTVGENVDPYSIFHLSRMKKGKKNRMIPMVKTGSILQSTGPVKSSEYSIPLTFEPYKKDFIMIRPATPLPPGEYMISNAAVSMTGFGIGVD